MPSGQEDLPEAKRELRHELEEPYVHKLCYLTDQHRSHRSRAQHVDNYNHQCHGWREYPPKLCDSVGRKDDKQDNKEGPPEHVDKDFKPCHVHGKNALPSYKECCANLRNQKTSSKVGTNNNSKRRQDSH